MKSILVKLFAWLLSWIINYKTIRIIKVIINKTVSCSIKRNLIRCGSNFVIDYPYNEVSGLEYINIGNNA